MLCMIIRIVYLEVILTNKLNIIIFIEDRKDIPKLSQFASTPGAMINAQGLERPLFRTTFFGPKYVREI